MRYYEIPQDTFDGLVTEAGLLLKNFDIEAAISSPTAKGFTNSDIICATTGGVKIDLTPTYSDLGEDVDNCPLNMMELKHLDSYEAKIAATGIGLTAGNLKDTIGAADIDADGFGVTPRMQLLQTDFQSIWWVSDKVNGGFVAAKLTNGLSTGGLSLQTGKNTKGQLTLEFTGHVSLAAQDVVPLKFYSTIAPTLSEVTVEPESGSTELFGTLVSDMQSGVTVANGAITGTLAFIPGGLAASGPLAGDGNFLALKFSDIDSKATSVKVGLDPSVQTGLVELIDDPDKNGVFKVSSNTQKFKVVSTDGTSTTTQVYSLAGLTLETS